jgi:multicomponent K+:H+ antiporter subunit E
MRHVLPHPLLSLCLLVMWLLLQQSWSPGQIILGSLIAIFAGRAMAALEPERPKIRNIGSIIKLVALVTVDILRSNIAVSRIISQGRHHKQTAGFIMVPLTLRDRLGLTVLACIITATPGSAWLEYDATHGVVLIHVLDLVDEQTWIETIKHRYERLLLEIFQ